MPNDIPRLAIAAFTSAIIVDVYHNRRHRKLVKAATEYVTQLQTICQLRDEQIEYLLHMIKTSDTPIDEFDAIALQQLNLLKK